jgi:hypothetical protein
MGDLLMKPSTTNDGENWLNSVLDHMRSNGDAVSRLGARVVVQCNFIGAVLPYLNQAQRRQVTQRFRQGIEYAMAQTDDVAMPAEYQTALLKETNILLNALRTESTRR